MPITSMTGFAREAGVSGPYQWAWELKSVNGRSLETRFRTPPGYESLGEEGRKTIQSALSRGQCQLNLSLSRTSAPPAIKINDDILQSLLDALGKLKLPNGVGPATLDGLLSVRGVIDFEEPQDENVEETLQQDLKNGLVRLVEALVEARMGEGAALLTVLKGQLGSIADLIGQAEAAPGRQPQVIMERLKAQIDQLLEARNNLDENRLYQEALIMASKADVREELDRLKAHVEAAHTLLDQGGAIGRKLDFLAQEFGREANTLCAKANDIALSRIGLELKAVVEQFREQVQNVE
ncbi:YicC/YloC family endoribonuclease [Microvirga sp. W0021]|uniref:YicC/YloC family endoribonuclease n=1 Tax=Hohaiivirga grylli TaxID=3133970 RepID=A0ABV0BHR9_9HYPH